MRGGHIPGARSGAVGTRGQRRRLVQVREDLEAITCRSRDSRPRTTWSRTCRIGERSSHTWFVLTHLLGFEAVRNSTVVVDRVGQRRARPDREVNP